MRPGIDRPPAQVDPARVRARQARDVLVGPHRHNPFALDRDGLGDRESLVHGDDLSVGENEIRERRRGRLGGGRHCPADDRAPRAQDHQPHMTTHLATSLLNPLRVPRSGPADVNAVSLPTHEPRKLKPALYTTPERSERSEDVLKPK